MAEIQPVNLQLRCLSRRDAAIQRKRGRVLWRKPFMTSKREWRGEEQTEQESKCSSVVEN